MGRLQTARLENFIRRWGSIKGPGSVLSETLGDVFPILDLENLTPENRLTAGISMVAGSASGLGGVAQLGGAQFINPADSGSLLTLTKLRLFTSAGQTVNCGLTTTLFTAFINTRNLDSRSPQNFNGSALAGGNTNTASSLGDFIVLTRSNIDYILDVPQGIAVMRPGTAFQVTASVTNILISATFWGYTRLAEPSELSF